MSWIRPFAAYFLSRRRRHLTIFDMRPPSPHYLQFVALRDLAPPEWLPRREEKEGMTGWSAYQERPYQFHPRMLRHL